MGKKLVSILGEQSGRMTALGLVVTLTVTMVLSGVLLSYRANAATLTSISDLLSVSAPSSASNHTITFTVTSAVPALGSISVDFDSGFTFGSVDFTDVDVASASDYTLAAAATGGTLGVTFNETAQRLLIALGNTGIAGGTVITIQIGTHATAGATGDQQITNPATTGSKAVTARSYNASNAMLDEGYTYVAIVNGVTLNAVVAPSFTFVIDGMLTSEAIDTQVVASQSEDTYVGFGTLTAGSPIMMGSSLSIQSNATNGFVVTVQQNHNMLASSNADIDCFANGTCSSTGATWSSPTGTIGSENTYGHLGLHTEDGSGTITNSASVSSTTNGDWFGLTTGTPATIWSYGGAADGVTQDIGHIDVGYRVEITALQEAGRYQSRLMYIATPTF